MSNLFWFQSWYVKHSFDADIEVSFTTNIDRGWKIVINLKNTPFSYLTDYQYTNGLKGLDWYRSELKDHVFTAEGNFTQLDFLIGKFRELIGETDFDKKKQDNFGDKDIQNFIFDNDKELISFLHYTCSKEVADQIIQTGFRFYDFDKSSCEAKNQSTELNYHHYILKQFGDYIVVISISKDLYISYLNKINASNSSITRVEEILTEDPIFLNENADNVYTLHQKFIKGYFNYYSKEIVKNESFDPFYDSEKFLQNINNANFC